MVKILFWHAKHRGVCLGFLYGGEWSVGDADCHDQFANWSGNDTVNKRCGVRADVGIGPYEFFAIQILAIKKGCR